MSRPSGILIIQTRQGGAQSADAPLSRWESARTRLSSKGGFACASFEHAYVFALKCLCVCVCA